MCSFYCFFFLHYVATTTTASTTSTAPLPSLGDSQFITTAEQIGSESGSLAAPARGRNVWRDRLLTLFFYAQTGSRAWCGWCRLAKPRPSSRGAPSPLTSVQKQADKAEHGSASSLLTLFYLSLSLSPFLPPTPAFHPFFTCRWRGEVKHSAGALPQIYCRLLRQSKDNARSDYLETMFLKSLSAFCFFSYQKWAFSSQKYPTHYRCSKIRFSFFNWSRRNSLISSFFSTVISSVWKRTLSMLHWADISQR